MPPGKGGNAKKEAGRAKKAENEAKKQAATAAAKVKASLIRKISLSHLLNIRLCRNTRKLIRGQTKM